MKDLRKAAADTGQAAAERGAAAIEEAVHRIQPLVEQAGEKVGPLAHQAKVASADFASRTLDAIQPGLDAALEKVSPAVETAQKKVQDDLLPKLSGLLHEAAEHPVVVEAGKRGEAAVAALKGEVEPPKKKSKFKGFLKVLAIGAIVAGAVAAVKKFLSSSDDGWTAHEPSKAYVNTTDNFAAATADAKPDTEKDAAPDTDVAEDAETPEDVTSETPVADVADADIETATMIDEGGPVEKGEETTAPTTEFVDETQAESQDHEYGDGAYVGENPPEGYSIKGNNRSMKYHVSGTGGYERTIPDVWFNSEEAAEAAGFTRAQR